MLNLFNNIKDPRVQDEIDVYDFLDRIKNPDPITKKKIELARLFKSQDEIEEYQKLKAQLTCFTLNFSFKERKTNKTIKEPTGFIYIDLDDNVYIDLKNELIFASWLSLSGRGRGVLVKVDNLTLENFKTTYLDIANQLNIDADNNAAKATQYCIHSFDEDVYRYDESITYQAKEEIIKSPNSVIYKKGKTKGATEIGDNSKLVYDNIGSIDFKGQDYIFFNDEKGLISKAWIPKSIPIKSRNSTLSAYAYQMKALNPTLTFNSLLGLILKVNNSCCVEPLQIDEIKSIAKKVFKIEDIIPLQNSSRRMIFNPNSKLTPNEKRAKTNKLNGERRREKTMKEIEDCLKSWDIEIQGKVTQKKVAQATGKSIKTIENYYKYFNPIIKDINLKYKSPN